MEHRNVVAQCIQDEKEFPLAVNGQKTTFEALVERRVRNEAEGSGLTDITESREGGRRGTWHGKIDVLLRSLTESRIEKNEEENDGEKELQDGRQREFESCEKRRENASFLPFGHRSFPAVSRAALLG